MTDDDRRALMDKLWELYKDDLPGLMPLKQKPIEQFRHINPTLRQVLAEMSSEDAKTLREALRFYRSANIVQRFLRWFGLLILLGLGAGGILGEKAVKFLAYVFGGKP